MVTSPVLRVSVVSFLEISSLHARHREFFEKPQIKLAGTILPDRAHVLLMAQTTD